MSMCPRPLKSSGSKPKSVRRWGGGESFLLLKLTVRGLSQVLVILYMNFLKLRILLSSRRLSSLSTMTRRKRGQDGWKEGSVCGGVVSEPPSLIQAAIMRCPP